MITDLEIAADGAVRQAAGDPDRFDAFIPSPCVQNHAANLMPLANGDLACVWFGGTQEGMSDISVYFCAAGPRRDAMVARGKAVRRSRRARSRTRCCSLPRMARCG